MVASASYAWSSRALPVHLRWRSRQFKDPDTYFLSTNSSAQRTTKRVVLKSNNAWQFIPHFYFIIMGNLVRPHSAWLQLWQQCQFHCTNRKPRLVPCMRGTTSKFFLLFWKHPQLSFTETPRSVDLNHFNSTEFTWQTLLAQPGSLGQRRCQQVYVTHPKQWI